MEFQVDTELEPGLRLQEDLGRGRGWRASRAGDSFRVFPGLDVPAVEAEAAVPGELVSTGSGEGWVAYPYRKQSLADFLEGHEGLPIDQALDMGMRIADVAVSMFAQGRLHLGLCAKGVFLGPEGSLEIAGYRGDLGDEAYVGYRPPEQRQRLEGGGASVTYAAGALLFHLLTGAPPAGPGGPPASQRNPSVPPWIDRVVGLSLEADPNHRYDSLKTFRSALGAARAAIRLRAADDAAPGSFTEISSTRPPPQSCGPASPLGRRRPGGLRPLPPEATQAGVEGAPVQDKVGMGGHPASIGAILPEREAPKAPEYRFSWKVTLTRGLPLLVFGGAVGGWMLLWLWSMIAG